MLIYQEQLIRKRKAVSANLIVEYSLTTNLKNPFGNEAKTPSFKRLDKKSKMIPLFSLFSPMMKEVHLFQSYFD